MKKKITIAIDGPAAAGKSTVAKIIAEKLSYIYIDTGAMYRAITYKALKGNIDLNSEELLTEALIASTIELKPNGHGHQLVFLDGLEVTDMIRENDVTNSVSIVAKHRKIREEMVSRQQKLAEDGGVVMDGRDIGTHVLPNADVKIFLLASVEERAQRRFEENITRGIDTSIEQLKAEIATRDKLDSEREVAPLKKAPDAIVIDTTSRSISEVVAEIMKIVNERI